MAQLSKGQTFTVNDTVTNTKLHTLVDNGTLASGAITEQVLQTAALTTSDVVLFSDVSAGTIAKLELAKLFAEPGPIGTTTPQPGAFTTLTATTATLTSATLTSASIGALTGAAQSIAKAWVNFNGSTFTLTNPQTTSSLTFSGTTITANFASSHGLNIGDSISIFNGTGNSTVLNTGSKAWTVATVPSGTSITFVISTIPGGALTNVAVHKVAIRSAYNVSSIGLTSAGAAQGRYIVNFSPGTFTDANYCALVTGTQFDNTTLGYCIGIEAAASSAGNPTLYTSTQCQILAQASTGANTDLAMINFVAFR
jgi:uncharacterized Fe-S cluster protein YjdI